MSDITCKVSDGDLRRILNSLNTAKTFAATAQSSRVHYKWTLDVLDDYKSAVVSAMGSVDAHGGSMRMSYASRGASRYWAPLADSTLKMYAKDFGYKKIPELESLRALFTIWKYTGETASALYVDVMDNFAGIDAGRYPKEFKRAVKVEEGGDSEIYRTDGSNTKTQIPARKLFAIANKLFVDAINAAMHNPSSKLRQELTGEFIQKVMLQEAKWHFSRNSQPLIRDRNKNINTVSVPT